MPGRDGLIRFVGAALVLHLVLIQPNHPAAMPWRALLLVPLELPVLVLALVALRGRALQVLRIALSGALTLLVILKTADFAMFTALARGFNPVADVMLIEAGLRLLAGSVGAGPAVLAGLGAILAAVGIGWAVWWATGVWGAIAPPRRTAWIAGTGAVLSAGLAVAEIGQAMGRWSLGVSPPGAAFTARVGVERVVMVRDTLRDLRAFRIAARQDPYAGASGLLGRIDRDVLVVFVESYGRTSLDTPFYAGMHRETLERNEAALRDLGLAMVSGLVTSPTRGGQSWLAHATFANGLLVNDQTRYGALLASGRETLFHIAARSGFRTVAVMPQITLNWPESAVMGFDRVLAAADLGYEGAAFNWVTMPDQFTFAALDRLVREDGTAAPSFVQVALGSSHAPWVPVPDLVAWETIGDGRVFDGMSTSGPSPDEVWRDRDRVRAQYRDAVDYALSVVFAYAARHAGDPPLMIVLGDHQAADFVALDTRAEVPVHVIGPKHLVARIAHWGWADGLIPDTGAPLRGMQDMRDLLIEAYSAPDVKAGSGGVTQ